MLTFDEAAHRYFWNGAPVPNVTGALSLLIDLSRVPPATLEKARQEGVDMHKMVELYLLDNLDEDTLPEWLKPRLDGFKRFVDETGFEGLVSEHRIYHPIHRYAGTLDMLGWMRVGASKHKHLALIDLKRSFAAGRAIGLQTVAYAAAVEHSTGHQNPKFRAGLRLLPDGTYRLEPFKDPSDFNHFLSCLNVYRLKESLQ